MEVVAVSRLSTSGRTSYRDFEVPGGRWGKEGQELRVEASASRHDMSLSEDGVMGCPPSPLPSPHSVVHSVIIVGAGMAGLGAATTLHEAGIDFLILEGQEQAGGRAYTERLDDLRHIEMGAQWVHGEHNPVFRMAAQAGLLSNITTGEGQGLYLKPDGVSVPLAMVQHVAAVVGDILEDCRKFVDQPDAPLSLGQHLTERFYQYLDACNDPPDTRKVKIDLFDWHIRFLMIDNSCETLNELSARAWGQYTGGADHHNLLRGYGSLVERLVQALPSGSLLTGRHITNISHQPGQPTVQLTCKGGARLEARHVVVTSSLGYLKRHQHTLFCPPLPPHLSKTIDEMGFDTIDKVFLVYETSWWPADLQGIQLVWDTADSSNPNHPSWLRDVSGFDVLADMSGVLLGWVGGRGAITMETLSDQEVAEHCTTALRRFMADPTIPAPDKIFRSRWCSNEFVLGGYSHTTSRCHEEDSGRAMLARPVVAAVSDDGEERPVIAGGGGGAHVVLLHHSRSLPVRRGTS